MKYDDDKLNKIYDKTDGCCHICHKRISYSNYGVHGAKGAWHVDHSIPRAKGGSNHLNNLYPACIPCNLGKSASTNRSVRPLYGNSRAPFSKAKKAKIKEQYTLGGATIGGLVGMFGGPVGAFAGAIIGGFIGNDSSPKK